jgi:hypothetical protein
LEFEVNKLFFVARIVERIVARKVDLVRAVPQQSFLTVLQIKFYIDGALLKSERSFIFLLLNPYDLLTILKNFFLLLDLCLE